MQMCSVVKVSGVALQLKYPFGKVGGKSWNTNLNKKHLKSINAYSGEKQPVNFKEIMKAEA